MNQPASKEKFDACQSPEYAIIDGHACLGEEYHLRLSAVDLLRRMDEHGISQAIVRPVGKELAVNYREGNDLLLRAHPRILAMMSVNPWYGEPALEEMRRCREMGAVGLYLHPSRQGFMPTDAMVRPLLDFAASAGWPVMFHTGTYVHSDILALGEVARLYPQISFIAGFGGYTDMWFELPGLFRDVSNLYLDASMMWGEAIEEIVPVAGAHRVLYGSAEPRNGYAVSLRTIERVDLQPAQRRALMHDNACRLFGLPAGAASQ